MPYFMSLNIFCLFLKVFVSVYCLARRDGPQWVWARGATRGASAESTGDYTLKLASMDKSIISNNFCLIVLVVNVVF